MGEETDPGGVDREWPGDIEAAIDRAVSPQGPTADVVFDLLSSSYRRFVLYCLDRHDGAMDEPQLVDAVVRLVETSRVQTSPTHDSVSMRLIHTTLPHLADAGIVVHDREAGVVWPTDAVAAMEPLLDLAAELDFESEPQIAEACVD